MTLYIVPTPIGNLQDITLRAIDVLKGVDFIIAEDTRHTRKLLAHLEIKKPMVGYYKHREKEKAGLIIKMLASQSGALVSDSGTPMISDPGFFLVQQAIKKGIEVTALPGPSAVLPALAVSGIDPASFLFIGFPPRKKGELLKLFTSLRSLPHTLVFYESAKRVMKLIEVAHEVLANRAFAGDDYRRVHPWINQRYKT
jgi:16S rRNA (cytidine1402-2'-O)-methyltransferase